MAAPITYESLLTIVEHWAVSGAPAERPRPATDGAACARSGAQGRRRRRRRGRGDQEDRARHRLGRGAHRHHRMDARSAEAPDESMPATARSLSRSRSWSRVYGLAKWASMPPPSCDRVVVERVRGQRDDRHSRADPAWPRARGSRAWPRSRPSPASGSPSGRGRPAGARSTSSASTPSDASMTSRPSECSTSRAIMRLTVVVFDDQHGARSDGPVAIESAHRRVEQSTGVRRSIDLQAQRERRIANPCPGGSRPRSAPPIASTMRWLIARPSRCRRGAACASRRPGEKAGRAARRLGRDADAGVANLEA